MTRNAIPPAILCFIGPGFTGGYIYGYKFALEPGLRDLRTGSSRQDALTAVQPRRFPTLRHLVWKAGNREIHSCARRLPKKGAP
jgi:hypothetical protein